MFAPLKLVFPAETPAPAEKSPPSRRGLDGGWTLSSMELRDGLEIREFFETLPAELFDLA